MDGTDRFDADRTIHLLEHYLTRPNLKPDNRYNSTTRLDSTAAHENNETVPIALSYLPPT